MYCRVLQALPGMAAQLTCTVANGPRSEWVNGASLFGELKDGYVFKISVTQARQCFLDYCYEGIDYWTRDAIFCKRLALKFLTSVQLV